MYSEWSGGLEEPKQFAVHWLYINNKVLKAYWPSPVHSAALVKEHLI